ncbi:MAG: diacylglycerol kinase family protein [Acidimicrobiia bacterium]|nr:diacylglycerol kinase family protein [Acidimicrobiia bacterium]
MRRLLLIANPSASGFTGAALREVTAALSATFAVEQEWPDGPEASRHAASKAAVASYDVVAAMGGDGVVHHVANGLVGSDTALAVIPAGTTNVLARLLAIPTKAKKAARAMATWKARPLQAVRVVADDREPFYATFALGVGYDAAVISRANQRPYGKVTWGPLHYARSALRELGDHGTPTIRLAAHGLRSDGAAISIQVQDNYTFLGRLAFGFGGDSPNGFNALALKGVRARTAATIARMATHRLKVSGGDATVWTDVSALTATAEPATPMQADGESYGRVERVSVEVADKRLLILAP